MNLKIVFGIYIQIIVLFLYVYFFFEMRDPYRSKDYLSGSL